MIDVKTTQTLTQLAKGIAKTFGSNCEVVIHSALEEDRNHSIIAIENGHVSGRKVGDTFSNSAQRVYTLPDHELQDKFDYQTTTADGRVLKSSTMFIRDEMNKVIAVVSINNDITDLLMARRAIENITSISSDSKPEKSNRNVNDLLEDLIDQSLKISGKPVAMMDKEDKIRAISFLNDAGAFLITKSGDKVSSFFGISKYTLYNYLDKGYQD